MISRMYHIEEAYQRKDEPAEEFVKRPCEIVASFKGFDQDFVTAERIAIVSIDGEPELFALDSGDHPVAELRRYLEFEWGLSPDCKIVGIYRKES